MHLNFDYIKMYPLYYFSLKCGRLISFARLLEIKKIITGVKCRF